MKKFADATAAAAAAFATTRIDCANFIGLIRRPQPAVRSVRSVRPSASYRDSRTCTASPSLYSEVRRKELCLFLQIISICTPYLLSMQNTFEYLRTSNSLRLIFSAEFDIVSFTGLS